MPTESRRNLARESSSRPVKRVPPTWTSPLLARSRPAMIIIIEDLPEPEGPTTLTVSPGSTIRSRPRRMWTGPAAEGRVSSTDSSAIMALEAGRDVVRAARCLEVMAHVGFSALNAYGPDGGVFNAGGCRGRRRLG